jgi:hypothetical protein
MASDLTDSSRVVTDREVESLLHLRENERRVVRMLLRLQESVAEYERDLISKIDSGADLSRCTYGLRIRRSKVSCALVIEVF